VIKPRLPKSRNTIARKRQPRPSRRLLNVRSALVFQLATLTAFGGAVLMIAAHTTIPETVLGAGAIFGAALKFYDDLIE